MSTSCLPENVTFPTFFGSFFGALCGHQFLKPILGRMLWTSVQFSQIWGLRWAPESGARTHILDVFRALGQTGGQEGSTATPRGAPSLNSERFGSIFESLLERFLSNEKARWREGHRQLDNGGCENSQYWATVRVGFLSVSAHPSWR